MKLKTRLIETRPKEPGTVLVKGKNPIRFLAIIHDFNEDPTWREAWIESALEAVFQETENRKIESIALILHSILAALKQFSYKDLKLIDLVV